MNTPHHRSRNRILLLGAACALASSLVAQDATRDARDRNRDTTNPSPITSPADPALPGARTRDAVGMKLSRGDRNFLEEAHKASLEEIALSQIAVAKATNPQVKEFAQMMIADHSNAGAELTTLVTAKAVDMDSKRVNVDRWEKKSAKEFDKDYMEKMVDDHEKVVKLFEKQSTKGEDPQITAFASKTLPALQSHLGKAREIQKMIK